MHCFYISCAGNLDGFVHHLYTSCIINLNGSVHYLYTSCITKPILDMFPNALFLHLLSIDFDITNFMGHDLTIIVVQKLFFIGLYGIDMDVIHLLVLFELKCHVHYLDTNVICLFVLFRHNCCMSICVVYTQKSCAWLLCLNIAWHSCLNDMNPWNTTFCTNLEWTHEAYKFVMDGSILTMSWYIFLSYFLCFKSFGWDFLHLCSCCYSRLINNLIAHLWAFVPFSFVRNYNLIQFEEFKLECFHGIWF
jgi:hypothetical protein